MTPEESQAIAFAGAVFVSNLDTLVFSCALFGIYMSAFTVSIRILLQREHHTLAHKALIGILLAGFVMTVLYNSQNIVVNLFLVKFGVVTSLPGGLIAQETVADSKCIVPTLLQEWSGNFIVLLADMAIAWRAWALWADNRLIKWPLLIMLLIDIAVNTASNLADTLAYFPLITQVANAVTLNWVGVVLNFGVNIAATLLIAYRAWKHHHSVHVILHKKQTQVGAILLLMVESGAILGVVQVCCIVINVLEIHAANPSPINTAKVFLGALYTYSAAINPVALVILVQTGNTYEDSFHLEDLPSLDINSAHMTSLGTQHPLGSHEVEGYF
ncbi:hypothetical protein BT96DRAFT_1003067 [Gymnopus androsaceus JB14]|uniref:G-protein coupled receptors family 1 profile domain-containing protein n=1 Tax=Gymnopus androsaceus JB14 TaxID=1447944 RepID=A0A6A4GX44_9AGAR|nr:hypothetical protein BT96DRAFT_1003067 [Gymnopus androsaceus JB14]